MPTIRDDVNRVSANRGTQVPWWPDWARGGGDLTSRTGGGGPPVVPPPVDGPPLIGPPVPAGGGFGAPRDTAAAAANLTEIFAPSTPASPAAPAAPALSAPSAPPEAASLSSGGGGGRRGRGGGGGIDAWIRQLMDKFLNDGGMGDDLRMDLRNQAQQTGKVRERDRILRRADDFAARGLFGSGLSKNAVSGIEAEESANIQTALNEIEFQNAQMEAQSLRDAIGALNAQIAWKIGKGQLNVQREQMALAKLQHAEQMALSWARFHWQQNQDILNRGGGSGTNPLADLPLPPSGGGSVGDSGGGGGGRGGDLGI